MINAPRWIVLCVASCVALSAQDLGSTFTIRAEKLYVGDGTVVSPAFITVADGRITAVASGPGASAPNAMIVDDAVVTPGFVEASSTEGLARGLAENEEGSEVTPAIRASAVLDRSDDGFRKMREAGVTTLVVAPGNRNVIGGMCVAVKSKDAPLSEMMLKDGVALHAVLGLEPAARNTSPRGVQTLFARRPNSRMGVVYEIRRAFQEGRERVDGAPRAKSPLSEAEGKILEAAVRGDFPIAIVAHAEQDIVTALNLVDEFKVPRFFVEGAVEAYLVRELLARRGVAALIGPVYHSTQVGEGGGGGRRGASASAIPILTERGGIIGGPRLLKEAGVKFGLSQGTSDPGATLLDYARAAWRGGLAAGDAIAAITGWPADIAGVGGRVGVIAVGRDADFNVFAGDPLAPTSRLVAVVIDGKLVFRAPTPAPESRRS